MQDNNNNKKTQTKTPKQKTLEIHIEDKACPLSSS